MEIVDLKYEHLDKAGEIFEEGIRTKNATFDTERPTADHLDKKFCKEPRLGAIIDGELAGWAVLVPYSNRYCYRGVGEVSMYIGENHRFKGIGKSLLKELIERSEQLGFWTLQAGIFPENTASVKMHKDLGFREVGRREKLGQMDGVWRDVILFERRSKVIE